MAIRIGSSCVTGTTKPTIHDKVAEVRHVVERNDFWTNVDFCLANNIYIIANLDNWSPTKGQLYYDNNEQGYRQRVDAIVQGLLQRDPTATKWRITIDNEPMKTLSRERYAWLVNIAYDQVKIKRGLARVKIGAGNEEFSLAQSKGNMLEYICQNCNFDIIDTHWQAAIVHPPTMRLSTSALDHWANFANYLRTTYKKPLGCSEANWFDVAKATGYQDLCTLLVKVESLGIEDFPIVFMQRERNTQSPYTWLCFIYDGKVRSPYWQDWLRIINEKAPKGDFNMYGFELNFARRGRTNEETRAVQQVLIDEGYDLGSWGADGIYGAQTEKAVTQWQEDNSLLVDGIVGKQTWQFIMENFKTGLLRFNQMLARIATYK